MPDFLKIGKLGEGMAYSKPHFRWQIHCRSGVLMAGACPDFLMMVYSVREFKRSAQVDLPLSTLRVQLFNPDGARVSSGDIQSALRALSDEKVLAAVQKRFQAATSPRATPAQPGACVGLVAAVLLVVFASAFSQAGVVAPPDSLNIETLPIFGDSVFRG